MTTPASLLVDGPRGRRLCLDYATGLDTGLARETGGNARLALAAALLANDLDAGATSHIFSSGPGATRPDATAAEVAALLDAVTPAPVRGDLVAEALRSSVDAAMTWQEPDGRDRVAALPELRAGLLRVAVAIAASPAAAEWDRPRLPEQWAVHWRADTAAPLPAGAAAYLAEWTRAVAEEEAIAREALPVSASGSWWSTPRRLLETRGSIADLLELNEDAGMLEVATVVPVRGDGRTLEISSPTDWAELCRAYPAEVTASRRHDWDRVTGREGRWLLPDWQRAAAEWDAVHLSTLGYLSSATRLIPIDDEYASVIGGWAPDSTLWLTDTAAETGAPRQQWRRPIGVRDAWLRTG